MSLPKSVHPGSKILVADGSLSLEVLEVAFCDGISDFVHHIV